MAHAQRDVKRYHRTKLLVSLVGTVVFLLYAAAWAWWGGEALVQLTEQRWIGLLLFAALFGGVHQVLTLPLDYYAEFVIEHRYELSNQSLTRWFAQTLKGWGFEPIPCPFMNYKIFGGGFHCATLDIRRRGELQSYF